ncbi:bacillithiol system protein YtxJ [Lewinella marina]|uniref:Bacillithiol system redox-active protein YtxJ n=1 Tax=Neolewinella marina TaxID=438751 RepID=A0A2G0CJJ0_9BACT|nr:bacillithiol system redox-active protein YtxJ [Neolewinella marina]NJB84697.1 bacillithiol system protein YtxJ [Neolewinella marina]PHL00135.1 bacillithiol system redox-active protein YtxJ [Neolewinella marina]
MNWNSITSVHDIEAIIERSHTVPCLILKHSTSCPISSMAKNRLEKQWDIEGDALEPYYLDLIRYREVSNYIASEFGVRHESPQVLLIRDGRCVYDASHLDIRIDELRQTA